jgi:hypothetical protein
MLDEDRKPLSKKGLIKADFPFARPRARTQQPIADDLAAQVRYQASAVEEAIDQSHHGYQAYNSIPTADDVAVQVQYQALAVEEATDQAYHGHQDDNKEVTSDSQV